MDVLVGVVFQPDVLDVGVDPDLVLVPCSAEADAGPVLVAAAQAGSDPVPVAAGPVPSLVNVVLFFARPICSPSPVVAEPGLDHPPAPVFGCVLVVAGLVPVLVSVLLLLVVPDAAVAVPVLDLPPAPGLCLVLVAAGLYPVLVEADAGLVPVLVSWSWSRSL